jgi:hypothetical protein
VVRLRFEIADIIRRANARISSRYRARLYWWQNGTARLGACYYNMLYNFA